MIKLVLLCSLSLLITACSPEVGSEEWCADIKAKKSGERTGDEIKAYTKYCILGIKKDK